MAPNRVILMSCGSFNPPTNMHLRMFETARDHLHQMGTHQVVGAVISPVHDSYSKNELTSAKHRCAMIKLATQSNDWIRLSTWETRQNDWTKTRVSLQHHQNLLNAILLDSTDMKNQLDVEDLDWVPENIGNEIDKSPIQIKLLCGADLLESFGKPGLWDERDIEAIVSQHGLVVVTRVGSCPNTFINSSDILYKHMNNIFIVTEWIPNEVSSTKIRQSLRQGRSIRYLVQDLVIDYIYKNTIYDAKEPSSTSTKFESTTINSNNYLNIDDKYQSVLLTPSPSDITMITPSSMEIINLDMDNKLMNIKNSPKKIDKIEHMNKSSLIYPGQAKQIITTETGESVIFCEVGSQSTGTNTEKIDEILSDNSKSRFSFNDENICDYGDCQVDEEYRKKERILPSEYIQEETEVPYSDTKENVDVDKASENILVTASIPEVEEDDSSCQDVQVRKSFTASITDKSDVNSEKSLKDIKSPKQIIPLIHEKIKEQDEINGPEDEENISQDNSESKKLEKSLSQEEISLTDEKEIDDFCSVCFSNDQAVQNTFYTFRSNTSSPNDLDVTECDICGSYDVDEAETMAGVPQCELCEICCDSTMDEDVVASSRPEPNDIIESKILSDLSHHTSLKKNIGSTRRVLDDVKVIDITGKDDALNDENIIDKIDEDKSNVTGIVENPDSTSIEEFSGDDSTLDDVEFEIENCGLDVDEKIVEETIEFEEGAGESTSNVEAKDNQVDIDPTRSNVFVGNRINRGSSLNSRSTEARSQSKRKYSSVDSLPNSQKPVDNAKQQNNVHTSSVSKSQGRFVGSVDNVRFPRASRSKNQFRMSADDIGKIKEAKEEGEEPQKFLVRHKSERNSRISPDTIKFVFSKHGIKIISDRETAL